MLRIGLLAGLLATLGCSPAYVYKAWRGHSRLVKGQRPLAEVATDPATPAELKERLALVEDVRRFAFERMGIPRSENYTRYVQVRGEAATWAVTGSRRTAFEAKTWWFPFIGRVPYLGFFERAAAEREAAKLEKRGFDAWVAGVPAYSTLRWLRDPVLSTMLRGSAGTTAELLLHELTHTAIYFSGQADFNEALATYFGEAGAAEFLAHRFGAASAEAEEYRRERALEADRSKRLDAAYEELAALYAGSGADADKLGRREPVLARHRELLGLKRLNNALLLGHHRYRFDLSDFQKAHERTGGDWAKLLAALKGLDRGEPRRALRRWLESPP